MKKNFLFKVCLLILCLTITPCLKSAAPQHQEDQSAFDDLFKDVDFEQLAKEMDQLFKEIEAEEKAKQDKPETKSPEQSFDIPEAPKTVPTVEAHPSTKKSNKKPEELFLKPETEKVSPDKKKQALWITQETLDATTIILDELAKAIDTLSNKIIEYSIVSLDELSLHLNNIDIIKVACGTIKSKTTYKRILLTPQAINKTLEKPMEQLRKDILQTIKKTHALSAKIKDVSAERRQQTDIDKLQAFAKKSTTDSAPTQKEKSKKKSFADIVGESDMTEIND